MKDKFCCKIALGLPSCSHHICADRSIYCSVHWTLDLYSQHVQRDSQTPPWLSSAVTSLSVSPAVHIISVQTAVYTVVCTEHWTRILNMSREIHRLPPWLSSAVLQCVCFPSDALLLCCRFYQAWAANSNTLPGYKGARRRENILLMFGGGKHILLLHFFHLGLAESFSGQPEGCFV